jgi:hypothetical protein
MVKSRNIYPKFLVPIYIVKKLTDIKAYNEDEVIKEHMLFRYIPGIGIKYKDISATTNTAENEKGLPVPSYDDIFEWFRNRGFYFNIRYNFNTSKDDNLYFYGIWIDDGEYGGIERRYYKTYKECREHLLNRLIEVCIEKYGN